MDSKFFKLCLKRKETIVEGTFARLDASKMRLSINARNSTLGDYFTSLKWNQKGMDQYRGNMDFLLFFYKYRIEHRDVQEIFQFQKKNNTEIFLTHFAHTTGMI